MPPFSGTSPHIHVPYASFKRFGPVLRAHALNVELYMDSASMDGIKEGDLHAVMDFLDWGPSLSVHGPFMDLSPGAVDSKIAATSLERYLQVMEFSRILRPKVVVFHAGYESWKYAGNVDIWLDKSVRTWRAVMDAADEAGTKVAIENIVDAEPGHLRLLAERMGHPMFGLCLDVGHREIFSSLTVEDWVRGMHPHIIELHLHDNDGGSDGHLPVGEGRVDFGSLFRSLGDLAADPLLTLEARSPEDALRSLENLKALLNL